MDREVKRLTARKKFEVCLETRKEGAKVGEILRKYGLHLNDLKRMEAAVEEAAVEALKGRRNGRAGDGKVRDEEYEALMRELGEKDKALAELTVEHVAKKSERSASRGRLKGATFTGRGGRR